MTPSRTVYLLPNGRELRQEASGGWAVQPPADNYWAEAATAQEALDIAGWKLRVKDLRSPAGPPRRKTYDNPDTA